MGGRSRQSRSERVGNFGFVAELSSDRLETYGRYSSAAYQNAIGPSTTQHGTPVNHDGLNRAAADEYIKRNGFAPGWDLRVISDAEYRHRKSLGFKDG